MCASVCVCERERERERRGKQKLGEWGERESGMKNESKFLLELLSKETNDKRAGNDLKKKCRTRVSLMTAIIIIMTGQR